MINYAVNYDTIVNTLCENRTQLEKNCNGKCYLAKELSKTNDQTHKDVIKSNAIDVFVAKEILFFTQANTFNFQELKIDSTDLMNYQSDYFCKIFHPPLVYNYF